MRSVLKLNSMRSNGHVHFVNLLGGVEQCEFKQSR
jgi:hypothetical protein